MKICFFNVNAYSVFDPRSEAALGGTEIQLVSIAEHLAKEDSLNVSFITGDWGQDEIEDFSGVKVYRCFSLKKRLSNYIKAPFLLWASLRKVDADVYIASSAGMEIGLVALFCRLYKKKFVYRTAHDWDCNGEYIDRSGFLGRVYHYGLTHAHAVVAQNYYHAGLLKQKYGISAVVIRNAWRIDLNVCENKDYVLWVARCEKWKNPELFLKIAKRLSGYRFVMICPGRKDEYFENLSKKASSLGNLRFIERVPLPEIQKYFDEAKLFLGTSEYEGFPNTYLQACIGSTPIVSYKVNPDGFITEDGLGSCANGDFELMICQISRMLKDEAMWEKCSRNAYAYVKRNHDISVIGRRWRDLLDGL